MAVLLFVASSQAAQTSREVPAEEILKKIEAGQPVKYDNKMIVGDLNVSKLKLPTVHVERNDDEKYYLGLSDDSKVIASAINITNSLIMGSIDFKGVTLQKNVDLRNTEILNDTYFSGARFNQSDFSYSKFNQSDFSYSKFNQSDFSYSKFNQSDFSYSKFNQSADFTGSMFDQSADFRGSIFNQESSFRDSHFFDVDFDDSKFSKETSFDGSKFNGNLFLYRTKYDKLNIRWSSIHDLAYDDTAYYLLIENFKKQGFFDDANECYYSYRCKHGWELLRQGKIFNWFFDSLAWGTYGYGLQPWQPLGWSICIIFLGGFFFWHSKGIMRKEGDDKDVSIWEALLLSATYYTSGASAIISSKPMEFTPQGKARYVVILLRLSGWIFFVLFLSSLTRIV